MKKNIDKKLLDTNSLVMGSGVGLATLEAMFNMVNTQSLLSANMVKHHELSHPLQMQALASAMVQILAAGEYGICGGEEIDIPYRRKRRRKTTGTGDDDTQSEFGAVSDLSALNDLLNKKSTGGGESTSNLNMDSTTMTGLDGAFMDKHLTELLDFFGGHLSEIVKSSKPDLAVT